MVNHDPTSAQITRKLLLERLPGVPFVLRVRRGAAEVLQGGDRLVAWLDCPPEDLLCRGWLSACVGSASDADLLPDFDQLSACSVVERLFRLRTAGGSRRWVLQLCCLLGKGEPDDHTVAGLLLDGESRAQLEDSARRYRDFTELSSDWYWEMDDQLRFTYFSREFEEITGVPIRAVLGKTRWEGLGDLSREGVDWEAHKRDLLARIPIRNFEYPSSKRPDRYLWFRVSGQPRFDEDGRFLGYIGVAAEIGDYKRIEEELRRTNEEQKALIRKLEQAQHQLLQSEKMASIGQLAAGVAHEINNPVGFVRSNLETLRGYVNSLLNLVNVFEVALRQPLDAAARDAAERECERVDLAYLREDVPALLDECRDGVERVKKIVQDLREFSRQGQRTVEATDLHAGLDSTLNIAANEIKYRAKVIKRYGALPLVECDPSQINQVFLNLLVNAAQAIEGADGTITISTGTFDEDWAWVEVADNGKGIAAEHLPHIFDPFFTTKPVGQGTGLGLAVTYGIAESHGGRIEVRSEPGTGSAFRVVLPIRR